MPTRFEFTGEVFSGPAMVTQYLIGDEAALTFGSFPTNDPVSTAFNNVHFSCSGVSGDSAAGGALHGVARVEIYASTIFRFRLNVRCNVLAHAHFLPLGTWSVTGLGKSWWFDTPGSARAFHSCRIRVICKRRDGTIRFARDGGWHIKHSIEAEGGDQADFNSGSVAPVLLEDFLDLSPELDVHTSDVVFVDAMQRVIGVTIAGGSFSLDFDQPGFGLNSPMAVINFDPT